MICGALQTLNEEAFEDVASSERPSPSGLPTGEMLAQLQLAPIRESSEFGSPCDDGQFITHNNLNHHPHHVHQHSPLINDFNNYNLHFNNNHGGSTLSLANVGGHINNGQVKEIDMYHIRHSLVGDSSTTASVHLLAAAQRAAAFDEEQRMNTTVPTVVVIPNIDANGVDDTKL